MYILLNTVDVAIKNYLYLFGSVTFRLLHFVLVTFRPVTFRLSNIWSMITFRQITFRL